VRAAADLGELVLQLVEAAENDRLGGEDCAPSRSPAGRIGRNRLADHLTNGRADGQAA
jgi:hypothetical protein